MSDKIDIAELRPGYSGIIATEDIESGEVVAYIPHEQCITQEKAEKSTIAQYLIDSDVISGDSNCRHHRSILPFMLYFMKERRNPFSEFASSIAVLPTDWSQFPILFSSEELDWLEGSQMGEWVSLLKEQTQACYDLVASSVADFGSKHSRQEFMEAFVAVHSRK